MFVKAKVLQCRAAAVRSGLVALTLVSGLALAAPAFALDWVNIQCTPGIECGQTGTPAFPCQCGFWKDSPGSLSENVFIFVESKNPDLDETGTWIARIDPNASAGFDQLRARAAANDSSILTISAYVDPLALESCSQDPAVAVSLQWGPKDDNSVFYAKVTPLIAAAPVIGLCITLTDDPDTAAPVSQRTSALVDMIQFRNSATGKMMAIEQFSQTQ